MPDGDNIIELILADRPRPPVMVYCVLCLDDAAEHDVVHIFSTQEKADEFSGSDPRRHVLYDYAIDHPERMEERAH